MTRPAFDERWLDATLHELAEADAAAQTPPHVEESLRAAFRAQAVRRARRPKGIWWLAAAAATLAVWGAVQERSPNRGAETAADADSDSFLALVEGEPLAELDAVQVVWVRLPGSALARLGGPVDAAADGSVDAQVIVGQDGIARAIRFVE